MRLSICILVLAVTAGFAESVWAPARPLNAPEHTGDIKEPRLAAAAKGGFHAVYRHFAKDNVQMQYCRFDGEVLLPPVEVHRLRFLAGGDICEAGDGAVHVVWENWAEANEQIGWAKSIDGGRNFSKPEIISAFGTLPNGQAKNPMVISFGSAGSPEVLVLSWGAPPEDALYYNRYDGSKWLGHTAVGQRTSNSYAAWGCARDRRDGSVYRGYGVQVGGTWQIACRRFDGRTWEPGMVVSEHTEDFASRPAMAISASGRLLVVWDKDEAVWARMRDPNGDWGPQMRLDHGYGPAVAAIPGRDEFYLVYPLPKGKWTRMVGRRWSADDWGAAVQVSRELPDGYSPNCDVAADEKGDVYCVWEYWGTGKPRAWFSVLREAP